MLSKLNFLILLFLIIGVQLSAQVTSVDDYALSFQNNKEELVKVTANDIKTCTNPVISIVAISKHGNATIVSDSIIKYTPNTDYIGKDSIEYQINNCGASNTAKLYINIVPLPDNINDSARCITEATGSIWNMSMLAESTVKNISTLSMILAGDVDGDGKTEIIVSEYGSNAYHGAALLIFDENLNLKYRIPTTHYSIRTPFAIANVDGDNTAAIFLVAYSKLIKYKFNGTTFIKDWEVTNSSDRGTPIIADFDNDGLAEILVLNKIYDASTGLLLATGVNLPNFGFGGHHMSDMTPSYMIPVDIDGDGKLEVVSGDCVYSVSIDRSNPALGKFEVLRRANVRADVGDGGTAVADMDLDGYPDVVVTRNIIVGGTHTGVLYIWNPRTGEIMNTNVINNIPGLFDGYRMGPSVPFIGDLDGDKEPEIAITGVRRMLAYKYSISTKELNVMWDIATTDRSGSTTMSLFDFNQDKNFELVYRDESNLRILDGATGTNLNLPIPFGSNTGNEYPIVADVNNDGRAEIVVVGGTGTAAYIGTVRIYGNENWAPARKVWNQLAYNVVNVNEDLTIPKHQLNTSTIFPGEDGILNTGDDIRPYNGFLMQQTILNRKGTPLFTIPEAQIGDFVPVYNYNGQKDSLAITVTINNTGEAALQAPINITIYKDVVLPANKIYTYQYNEKIDAKVIQQLVVEIPNFSTHAGVTTSNTKFIVKINDIGDTNDDQEVCGNDNTTTDYSLADFIKLNKDQVTIIACDSLLIDVLANDNVLPDFVLHNITINGKLGTAVMDNGKIKYTTKATDCCSFQGRTDTIKYVVCNTNEDYCDTAMLNIYILPCPEVKLIDSCSYSPKMQLTTQYVDTNYLWQYVEYENYNGENTVWTDLTGNNIEYQGTTPGYYRVRIDNKGNYFYTKHYKLVQHEKVKISDKWWYSMSLE